MGKIVVLDQDECIGCESCVGICPEVFQFNADTGKAEVILAEGGPEDLVDESIASCPAQCIRWEE